MKAIIYYSYDNNTKKIVEEIIKENEIDVYEIKPIEKFNENREEFEKEQELIKDLEKIIEIEELNINLDNYDELIIGTPVWWYTMSSPIRSFLKKYDLSNKTIIPFATNEGGLGTTFEDFKKYCPNSEIKNEMSIKFKNNELETNLVGLTDWINSL